MSMLCRWIGLVLLSFHLQALASVDTKPKPEEGLWTGSLAGRSVLVCLQRDTATDSEYQPGFFDLRTGKLIRLRPDPTNETQWLQDDPKDAAMRWVFKVQGDRLQGAAISDTGSRSAPISLSRFRVSHRPDHQSCSPRESLFDPKVFTHKILVGQEKTLQDKRYRVLTAKGKDISAIELIGDTAPIKQMNRWFANQLREDLNEAFNCPDSEARDAGVSRTYNPQNFDSRMEPLFWSDRWLSILVHNSSFCGGAHTNIFFRYQTWDLASGREIDLWRWFRGQSQGKISIQSQEFRYGQTAPDGLNRLLVKKAVALRLARSKGGKTNPEQCLEALRTNNEYLVYLSQGGMTFIPDFNYAGLGCAEDIETSLDEITPFLNSEGKRQVAAIKAASNP